MQRDMRSRNILRAKRVTCVLVFVSGKRLLPLRVPVTTPLHPTPQFEKLTSLQAARPAAMPNVRPQDLFKLQSSPEEKSKPLPAAERAQGIVNNLSFFSYTEDFNHYKFSSLSNRR